MSKTSDKNKLNSFEENFKRSVSPMIVLLVLSEKPMYAYRLSQELEKRSNHTYKMNFLYPVLYKLQKDGYIVEFSQETTESHRTRNYYTITDSGKLYLDFLIKKYNELLSAVDIFLENKNIAEKQIFQSTFNH